MPVAPARTGARGRRSAAAMVAVVVVAAGATLLVTGAQVRPGTAAATPAPENRAAEVADLLAHLPTGFSGRNCHAAGSSDTAGATAVVTCTAGPAGGPDSATFARYPDALAVATAFDTIGRVHRVLPNLTDPVCRDGGTGRAIWHFGDDPAITFGGQIACYRDGSGDHLVWTNAGEAILSVVTREDGDAATLYAWWSRTGVS